MFSKVNMPETAWINEYPKAELVSLAVTYGIDASGRLDDIRARVRTYVREHPEQFESTPRYTKPRPVTNQDELPGATADNNPPLIRLNSPVPPNTATTPMVFPPLSTMTPRRKENPEPCAKILNQIRKWGCQFDGRDPVAFLERVDELREGYC